MKTEHTPTGQWYVESGAIRAKLQRGLGFYSVAIAEMDREPGNGTLPVERDENAKLIVLAVNNFEKMREALTEIAHEIREGRVTLPTITFEKMAEALSAIEQEQNR